MEQCNAVQVVVNLLVNAAKYSPPDRRIEIEAKAIGEFAVIRVRDQGEGLDAELQSRVFEAFTQARQTLDRRRGGLGLGLAIVRNLVELHGGSVAATSEGKGRGSEFSVRLPLLGGAGDEPFADAPIATAPASFGNVSTRVLLVDDHVAGAQSMRDLLQAMGYAVHIEHSGPAALAAVQACQPTIALLDIGLPGMDGYALARALHAMPGFSKLPLIALTGYGQAEDRERTRAAGFDEHVTKPIRADELVSLIEKLVHA
ncbi:MAG TPA: ATP-binding protein [Rhodanobacteraceae bacterium]